jgi:hypothetical protein
MDDVGDDMHGPRKKMPPEKQMMPTLINVDSRSQQRRREDGYDI